MRIYPSRCAAPVRMNSTSNRLVLLAIYMGNVARPEAASAARRKRAGGRAECF